MPGLGRFARKKQPSQEAPAPAAAPAAAAAPGKEPTAVPDAAAGDRPATAFVSLENDRPATSGSYGFSAIGNGFGQEGVGGDVGMYLDAAPAEGGEAVGMEGVQFDFGGGIGGGGGDGGGFGAFGGFGMEEEQPSGAKSNASESAVIEFLARLSTFE